MLYFSKEQVPATDAVSRIKELDAVIVKEKRALESLKTASASLEKEIKDLQSKVMDAGGVRLRGQQAKVDSIQEQIGGTNDRLTRLQVEQKTREKNIIKVAKSVEKKENELSEMHEQLQQINEELKALAQSSQSIRATVQEQSHVN